MVTDIVTRARSAPAIALEELTGAGDVVVLAPHPDDESLAMGGAIAAAAEAGHQVHVVVVTDGSRSHPNSTSHPPNVLSALRWAEVNAAVSILTSLKSRPVWLGYPDMAAPDSPSEFEAIATRLGDVLHGSSAVWTTWDGDPHPDHQRTWRLGMYLAERHSRLKLFACPVWGRVQRPMREVRPGGMRRFPTRAYRSIKARAVAAHASQMTGLIHDDPSGFRMPAELALHFIETDEIFITS